MLDPIQAIILGIVQGLTEFLPISSSGHLVLVRWLLGWPDPGLAFDVALHVGTLVAVAIYFWVDWINLIQGGVRSIFRLRLDEEGRLAWILVVATIPGAIAGALLEKRVDEMFHGGGEGPISPRSIMIIATVLIIVGIILYTADRVGRRKRELRTLNWVEGLAIGVAQMFAIIPGVSRSGATISAALGIGLTRPAAAKFSFLLSGPIILGAALKSAVTIAREGIPPGEVGAFVVGMITSAIVGYAAIAFMLNYLQRNSVVVFTLYRIVFGLFVLVVAFTRM